MPLYMLDTNTVSYILKNRSPAARQRLASLAGADVACVSAITEGELRYGWTRVQAGAERVRALELFLARVPGRAWDHDAARAYGAVRAEQERWGYPLGPLDTQIAAHAVAAGAVLVTSDAAFARVRGVPGLENWATDLGRA